MNKFRVGEKVIPIKIPQKGHIGTIEKVIALPWIETEYQVGFNTEPYTVMHLESDLQKASYQETHATDEAHDYPHLLSDGEPKYPIGTRVRIINEEFRNGEIGYVVEIKERKALNDHIGYTYYVRFRDGSVPSFYEKNITIDSGLIKYTTEAIKSRGAVSSAFTKAGYLAEAYSESKIKAVTLGDVTSKHFVDWFFKMDDWAEITPEEFPFDMITRSDEISVYGYFNGYKLDGIIRVDEEDDSYELSFFFVNKTYQNRGIGQHLFQFILKRFNDKKQILHVYTDNALAIHIYKKYGFQIVGTEYDLVYRPTSPHYVMQRDAQKQPLH